MTSLGTMPQSLSRRRLLGAGALAGIAGALAACSDNGDDGSVPTAATVVNALIASFPRGEPYAAAGAPMRMPYLIADGQGVPLSDIDGPVEFRVRRDGRAVGEAIEVPAHSDGIPRAYLPFTFTFPDPGTYDVVARYRGQELDASAIEVVERSSVPVPMIGDPLPAADTPTATAGFGVDPICSRSEPCPLHGINLRDALSQRQPLVLVVSTPAYCQTAICGPILDLAVNLADRRSDLRFIHTEVYANPTAVDDLTQAALAPAPAALGLTFEPTVFVVAADGRIAARGDIIVDRTEFEAMTALV